jgi:hypothetical protein
MDANETLPGALPQGALAVTLTVDQLQAIVAQAVRDEMQAALEPRKPRAKRSVAISGFGRCYRPAYWIKQRSNGAKRWYENLTWYVEYRKHGKVYQECAKTKNQREAIKFLRQRVASR